MSELWKVESRVLDFFTYTCPKLYDLNTLAYWIYEKDAHSKEFMAGISHITQIVFALNYTAGDFFDFNIQKMEGRSSIFNTSTHKFKLLKNDVRFQEKKLDDFLKIGDKVKYLRKKNNKTQSELAAILGLTPGAVSQIENSIISPSLNTLLQLSSIFNKTPEYFFGDMPLKNKNAGYKINKKNQLPKYPNKKIIIYDLIDNDDLSIKLFSVLMKAGQTIEEPLFFHKGDEILYVTEGSLSITIDQDNLELAKGESILLNKSFIKKWHNKGDEKCEFIYILF